MLNRFNASYLTGSRIVFTLKMESVSKIKFFGLKMMVTKKVTKIAIPHGRKSEIFFLTYVLDLIKLLEQKFYPDSNLRVKLMYESVK